MKYRKSTNKEKIQRDPSLPSLELNKKFQEFLRFQKIYERLEKTSKEETVHHEEILVPLSIVNETLTVFESLCKYCKENLHFSNKKIAQLLNKNSKSIWQAYHNANKKHPTPLSTVSSQLIPLSIFRSRKSVLAALVLFLKDELHLRYHDIGEELKRDERTIWTVYHREKNEAR